MRELLALDFFEAWQEIQKTGLLMIGRTSLSATERGQLRQKVENLVKIARTLQLRATLQGADRFRGSYRDAKADQLNNGLQSLLERFVDDLLGIRFLYLPNDKLSYHQKTDLFGDTFKLHFPAANVEVIEAGNCFAFGRFTACAFHLMRSLEIVLRSMFTALGLPPVKTAGGQNWNGLLREIRGHLDANKGMPDYDFYDSAYAFLAAAKNPMRNATVHVDVAYDEESVKPVFDAGGAFARHVATKLKEQA